ncbi:MAG: response regulator [Anaerolineae bacterium]|nr:response regulator [Anaerolineae bacterium]MDW8100582.1 response regulator [Anaerolineae bacterium]
MLLKLSGIRGGVLPNTFIEHVKQALEHLYDFPYLQCHPLAQEIGPAPDRPGETAGQRLRRELIAAIETLNPGPEVPFRAPHARLYNLLHLHYVEGLTIQEAAHELGISLRQAYRDLRRGEESVAMVLWTRRPTTSPPEPRAVQLSSIEAEMARLETHPRPTDVRSLLQRAQNAVERLALQRSVTFQTKIPPEPAIVSTDPTVAQQVLVSLLSHAVQQAQPGALDLTLMISQGDAILLLHYTPERKTSSVPVVDPVTAQLVDRLKWTVRETSEPGGQQTIVLHMATHGPTVLVIDDNEGLVELLERYLTGHGCRVVSAASGREGLELAETIQPDAIVLDIMMPEVDGWEILQTLRTRPQTASVPILVCSVFNDPELAYSLGASLFLPKPVRRDDILAALRQLSVV